MEAVNGNTTVLGSSGPKASDDEIQAQKNAAKDDPEKMTRNWLLQTSAATLCTLAAKPAIAGFPFGSVVPFALDGTGAPLIYLADMAAHAANLRADNRATLFVREEGLEGDPQKGWRVGVIGRFRRLVLDDDEAPTDAINERVGDSAHERMMARYIERVPWAIDYGRTHNFSLWRMSDVESVRYIAGFGKISWLGRKAVDRPDASDEFTSAARAAVDHMNNDHADAIEELVTMRTGERPFAASLVSLDQSGFLVHAVGPDRLLHFSFAEEIKADAIRRAVVGTLKQLRRQSANQ